jgi:hypothetical protein
MLDHSGRRRSGAGDPFDQSQMHGALRRFSAGRPSSTGAARHAKEENMRMQLVTKPHLPVLLVGAFCGAAMVLGAQALSKGPQHQSEMGLAKATTTVPKTHPSAAPAAATTSDDLSEGQTSWKRWPSLTDF